MRRITDEDFIQSRIYLETAGIQIRRVRPHPRQLDNPGSSSSWSLLLEQLESLVEEALQGSQVSTDHAAWQTSHS